MACRVGDGIVICGQFRDVACRRVLFCWNCDRRRHFAQRFGGIWYGDTLICLGCGEEWMGHEHMPRPFSPGWRKKNIARGRRWLESAITVAEFDAFVRAEAEPEFGSEVSA